MRLQSGALAGERRSAYGRYGVEIGAQPGGRVGVGAQVLDLAVDAGAALLVGGLVLGPARRDVGGDLVPLVGERVGEGQGVLGALRQRHQVLGVVQPL